MSLFIVIIEDTDTGTWWDDPEDGFATLAAAEQDAQRLLLRRSLPAGYDAVIYECREVKRIPRPAT